MESWELEYPNIWLKAILSFGGFGAFDVLKSWYISYCLYNLKFFAKKCSCEASHPRDGVNQRPMRPYGVGCWRCLRVVRSVGRNMRYFMNDLHFSAINMLMWGLKHSRLLESRPDATIWCGVEASFVRFSLYSRAYGCVSPTQCYKTLQTNA